MRKNLLLVLLVASLLLNVMAIGGFAYVRYYGMFHLRLDAVSRRLDLDDAGRARLVQFRRDAWRMLLDTRKANQQTVLEINQAIAGKPLGDPAFGTALDHLSAARRERQDKLVALTIGFRDSLTPASRERFTNMAQNPGFLFDLMGLRLDNSSP
jgi:uncharacterized membrane protein